MLRAPSSLPKPSKAHQVRGVLDSLRRVVRDLRLTARDAERIAGISGAQLFVLQMLADAPAESLNDLAERTMTDQSSVSVVVRRLVDRKLVTRKVSPEDSRRLELSLSASGRRLLARCPEPTQARLLTALRRLSPAELSSLAAGMGGLVREMGIEEAQARMFFDDPSTPAPAAKAGGPRVARTARRRAHDGAKNGTARGGAR